MTTSYGAILAVTYATLLTLAALIRANGRISREDKRRFYLICGLIMFSAFWEGLSVALNGASDWTRGLHTLAKCMDYIVTPICSVLFIRQVAPRSRAWTPMAVILGGNTVLQIVSAFTGWTFYIDADNIFRHGPYHFIYIPVYALAALFVVYAFLEYGRKYERQNRSALFAILGLLCLCVLLQELLGGEARVIYLGLSIASCMLFIHYTEFSQIEQDAALQRQDRLLATDALTGVHSRFAYKQVLAEHDAMPSLPSWLSAFEVDLNGLKMVNDTQGHEAGDELLRGTGAVLLQAIGSAGQVFRIGGDEFVILLDSRAMAPEQAVERLRAASAAWHGELAQEMSLSIGTASAAEFPAWDLTQLVHEADQRMYIDKDRYYSMPGHERRRGPRGATTA